MQGKYRFSQLRYNIAFRRPEITKKQPGVKITEISTIIGNEWKDLTEDEKNVSCFIAYLDMERKS